MGELFGTDGIRGIANKYPLTPEMGLKLGRSIARFAEGRQIRVIIGRDTRLSGPMLECALEAGLMGEGVEVLGAGVIPTPAVAYLTRELRCHFGLVISASHNPFEYNGFKVFSSQGTKLTEHQELKLEKIILNPLDEPSTLDMGTLSEVKGAEDLYVGFLRGCYREIERLEGLRLVLDCANGATYIVAPMVFGQVGASLDLLGVEPDGRNINRGCGSQHPHHLASKVVAAGASLGLAFDGDGDRLVAVDEGGEILTGDQLLAIFANVLKEQGKLDNNIVVSTVMSNIGLKIALSNMGIRHVAVQVGDRNVYQEMVRLGSVLGGEESGHIILRQHHCTGDGILSALQLLAAMDYFGKPLSELKKVMEVFPQVLINVPVGRKPPLEEIGQVKAVIEKVERELGGNGRVLVRYSGTESVCRVMVEGDSRDRINAYAQEIAEVIAKLLGDN